MARKKINISDDSILYRNPDVQFSKIDQEIVLLSPDGANYLKLNEIGSRIWELLKCKLSYLDLILKIIDEYDILKEECEKDVLPFLQIAIQKEIICLETND